MEKSQQPTGSSLELAAPRVSRRVLLMLGSLAAFDLSGCGGSSTSATPAGPSLTVSTLAGSGSYATDANSTVGIGTSASFSFPKGIAVDGGGNVYFSDGNGLIHAVANSNAAVTILAGQYNVNATTDGTGTGAAFNSPAGLAVDASGNLYVAEVFGNSIRKIEISTGAVTTLAGSGAAGTTDATGAAASFNHPHGVAVDSAGNVYVADTDNNLIRKISSAGVVTTLAGSGAAGAVDGNGTAASFNKPEGIVVDSAGNLYVADTVNHTVRKITSAGVVTTLAGSGASGSSDGTGIAATFNKPGGLAMDASGGNLYVADTYNLKIRKIEVATGIVTTVADSSGIAIPFNYPYGVAVDALGAIFVADYGSNRIRKIS